jgi:sugar lactone lactonase YvrE
MKATLLYHSSDILGESATWLADSNQFLWVDIDRGILHQYNPTTKQVTDTSLGTNVSTIIPWKKNQIILALKGSLVSLDLTTGIQSPLIDIAKEEPMLRPNDGKASPDGRIFMGVMHQSNHNETGSLYRIDKDLSIHKVLSKQHIPNGIVWNAAGDRLYYVDSGRGVIEAYVYDKQTGEIVFDRVAVQVPAEMGVPDGMTIDARGYLWVAHWGGFCVGVWNPATGCLIEKVEVPVPHVTSCTFGNAGELYITTARSGLSPEMLDRYPMSGALFTAQVSVLPGINHYLFERV